MPKPAVGRFICPNCAALYMVVRVRAAPLAFYLQVTCRSCGGVLDAQEGHFILKYFLLAEQIPQSKFPANSLLQLDVTEWPRHRFPHSRGKTLRP